MPRGTSILPPGSQLGNRGGRRTGAGRPTGTKNAIIPQSTSSYRAKQALSAAIGNDTINEMDALDILQTVVRISFSLGEYETVWKACSVLLPYLHPKAKFRDGEIDKPAGAELLSDKQLFAIISSIPINNNAAVPVQATITETKPETKTAKR